MTEAQEKKPNVDWERIEHDFRAGIKSVLQIGKENGVSHTAINKRMKKLGITRDLSAKIKQQAEALVSARAVSASVSTETTPRDAEIVEANAQLQANIVLSHRTDIQRSRALVMKLLAELEISTDHLELLETLAAEITDGDQNNRRYEAFMKAIGLPSRAGSMDKLAGALKTLVGLEREAFGLNAPEAPKRPLEDMTDEEVEAQVRALLGRMHV